MRLSNLIVPSNGHNYLLGHSSDDGMMHAMSPEDIAQSGWI
ncbi:hypothetical protein [Fulvivirga kasyanovii]